MSNVDKFTADLTFRRLTPATCYRYLRIARMYPYPDFTRSSVMAFMGTFRECSGTYAKFVLHVLKSMAASLGEPWVLTRRDAPRSSTIPKRPFLTWEQFQALLRDASSNPRDYAILRVAGATCARREELTRMMMEDYRRPVLKIRTAKGGEPGACTLDPATCDALAVYLEGRRQASRFLFCGPRGEAMSVETLSQMFRRYADGIGLPDGVGLHAIRRGVATWLFNAGMRERELQDVGRWKSPAMPAVYVQLVPGQVDREVQKKHPMWKP